MRGYLPLRQCPVVSAIRLSAPWVNRMGRTHLAVKGCLGPEALPSLLLSLEDDLHAVLRLSRLPPSPWVHIREELFGGSSVLPESVLAVCGRGAACGMILLIRASSQMLPVLSYDFRGHPARTNKKQISDPPKSGVDGKNILRRLHPAAGAGPGAERVGRARPRGGGVLENTFIRLWRSLSE